MTPPQVFVRTTDGWVTAPWTHLPMVAAPFAEFTWRYARHLAAEKGRDDTNETEVARVLDELLTRARGRPGRQAHRPDHRPRPCRRDRAPPADPGGRHAVGNAGHDPARTSRDGPLVNRDPVRGLRRRTPKPRSGYEGMVASPTAGRAPTPTPSTTWVAMTR